VKLLIAIPALDEEASIESIIARCLAARDHIVASSPVTEVEITVVSDGSTDRTVERAQGFADRIRLIVFPENRGYGAAIQAAWRDSDAEILGFLDADGTCEPEAFAELCRALDERRADVVLGSRMHRESKMPLVRRVGNRLFAWTLTMFSSRRVRDTASGMRVVRRSSLPRIMPLPTGLDFTPAMSARAILSEDLEITEVEVPYHEREGRSKLRVGRDGVRFLRVILMAALLYRPSRPLGLAGLTAIATACGLMLMPTLFYLEHRRVLGWMIYRFIVSDLAASGGILMLCASFLTAKIVRITLSRRLAEKRSPWDRFFASPWFWTVPSGFVVAGGLLVLPSFLELVTSGVTFEHWSRFIAMSFLYSCALTLVVTWGMNYSLRLIADRLAYLESLDPAGGRG